MLIDGRRREGSSSGFSLRAMDDERVYGPESGQVGDQERLGRAPDGRDLEIRKGRGGAMTMAMMTATVNDELPGDGERDLMAALDAVRAEED
mgnify:CR=1 FL=1